MKHTLTRLLTIGLAITALVCIDRTYAAARPSADLSGPDVESSTPLSEIFSLLPWAYLPGMQGVELGSSVHTAGDVNGDGYSDIIIGAPLYGAEKEGAAFVFHGGAGGLGADSDWDVGGLKGDLFGGAVSTAGDVNDDGYDDVIIGAENYNVDFGQNGEPPSGAAFVYYGSIDGLSEQPVWSDEAKSKEIAFGRAVSGAGDVNNDGYADVIVGAPWYESDDTQVSEGKAYLYLGSADGLSDTPDWTFECDQAGALCGTSVDGAGDLNGDGYDDLVVGAPRWDTPDGEVGRVFVFYGSASEPSLDPDWILDGDVVGSRFGASVAGAGNTNGDGYDDLVVGAPGVSLNPQNGAAYVFYGSPSQPADGSSWETTGLEVGCRYGYSVHGAGDVDQDGYSDIIIGAYLLGTEGGENQPEEGGAYVFRGSATGVETTASWSDTGGKANAWYGYSVSGAGDVNGDSADDILIGAPLYKSDEKTPMGKAIAYYSEGPVDRQYLVFLPITFTQAEE